MKDLESSSKSKPFVKWAGGKRQLLEELKSLVPKDYNRYFEPFIGGGALFFELMPKDAVINDYNKELINLYRIVKSSPIELFNDTQKHKNTENYYYEMRSIDRDIKNFEKLSEIERASRFLYLNKSGFNGLYRVNSKNQNNVPFGRYKNPQYCDLINITVCSNLLQTTEILCGDFRGIKEMINEGDFVYFDPPYMPITKTSSFTGYTDKGFDEVMQLELKELCDYIDYIGAYFMLSNSYTEYINNLYSNKYTIHTVEANRNINSRGDRRGKVKEVLIVNYN